MAHVDEVPVPPSQGDNHQPRHRQVGSAARAIVCRHSAARTTGSRRASRGETWSCAKHEVSHNSFFFPPAREQAKGIAWAYKVRASPLSRGCTSGSRSEGS